MQREVNILMFTVPGQALVVRFYGIVHRTAGMYLSFPMRISFQRARCCQEMSRWRVLEYIDGAKKITVPTTSGKVSYLPRVLTAFRHPTRCASAMGGDGRLGPC